MELLSKQRRAKLEAFVDLKNLAYNFRVMRRYAGDSRVCCVVKADAYGHGAWECVRRLAEEGADFFAVSSVAEAEEVRLALAEYGDSVGILILGYTLPEDTDLLLKYHITQTVFSKEYAEQLRNAVQTCRKNGTAGEKERLSVHIKIDTGMNRLGFSPDAVGEILSVCAMEELSPDGIFTHFAQSDTPASPMTEEQYARFCGCIDALAENGRRFALRHCCNSAAITDFPQMRMDMVRLGVELYGLKPSDETVLPAEGLRPVMTLKTVISHIHTVRAGESVGYGASFVPEHDIRLATLPVGYADGFVRTYGGWSVRIRGKDAPIRGKICMDQCMADITDIPDAAVGDEVLLFGENARSADELAACAGTIGYETLCLIGRRVPRVYER